MDPNNPSGSDTVQKTPNQPPLPTYTMVSGGHKEHAPIAPHVESVAVSPVESAPEVTAEVAEVGVEQSPDTEKPDIAPDLRRAGVQPVKTATPVTVAPTQQTQHVSLPTPMNYQQATTNLKKHKADESVTWLSMLSKYVLEKLGMQQA